MMTQQEMAINKKDLSAFLTGESTLSSMIPGIRAVDAKKGSKAPQEPPKNSDSPAL